VIGAEVVFAALPGLTVGGAADETMRFCPLAVPHVTGKVMSTGSGFSVDVTSETEDNALRVVRRAPALSNAGPGREMIGIGGRPRRELAPWPDGFLLGPQGLRGESSRSGTFAAVVADRDQP
jgi:hypothetical protein